MQVLRDEVSQRDVDADTARMMLNWARWRSGVPIGLAVTSAYDLEAPGRREETSVPLLNGEAMDVDKAVESLPAELHDVVARHWLSAKGTVTQKARACGCSLATYYRRLAHGHERIRAFLMALRARSARMRARHRALLQR